MTSLINACRFDENGGTDYKDINPLDPLRQNQPLDITTLIHEIVTKDFGYTGTAKYTLSLKNDEMVLQIWDNPTGTAKTEFARLTSSTPGQWQRSDGKTSTVTDLTNGVATNNRLAETLTKVSNAYRSANPNLISSPNSKPNVNVSANSVPCDHSGLDHTLEKLDFTLNQLTQRIEKLENSSNIQQPQTRESLQAVQKLSEQVELLGRKIQDVEHDVRSLKEENQQLKNLKKPLEQINSTLQEKLGEIDLTLQEIKTSLQRIPGKSEPTQELLLSTIASQLKKVPQQIEDLTQSIQSLRKENETLRQENNSLKNTLSLKDREIEVLKKENSEKQEKLQQRLEKINLLEQQNSSLISLNDRLGNAIEQLTQKENKIGLELKSLREQNQHLRELELSNKGSEKDQQIIVAQKKTIEQQEKLNNSLEEQLQTTKQAKEELQNQIKRLQQLNDQIAPLEEKIRKAEQTNQTLASEVRLSKQALESERNNVLSESEKTISKLKSKLLEKQQNLESNNLSLIDAAEKIEQLELENKKLEQKIQTLSEAPVKDDQELLHIQKEHEQTLEAMSLLKQQFEKLNKENLRLREGLNKVQSITEHDKEHILTLQDMNQRLSSEKSQLEQEIRQLKSQQDQAQKADKVSKEQINKLGLEIVGKEKQLIEEQQKVKIAQGTAEKATLVSRQLQHELGEMTERNKEAQLQIQYLEGLLSNKSKAAAKAQSELNDLQREYNDFSETSNQLEYELEQKITELQEQLKSMQSLGQKIDPSELHEKHILELESLTRSLNEATEQKKVAREQKEISERLYLKQNEELKRRNDELELELLSLKDKLILNERLLKQRTSPTTQNPTRALKTIDLSDKPDVPSLEDETERTTTVDNGLANIQQVIQEATNSKVINCNAKWINSVLVNFALLDREQSPNKETFSKNISKWINDKKIDSNVFVNRTTLDVQLNNTSSNGRNFKFENVSKTIGNINNVLGSKFLKSLKDIKTLDNVFEQQQAYIVHGLTAHYNELDTLIKQLEGQFLLKSQLEIKRKAINARDQIKAIKNSLRELSKLQLIVE